MFFLQISTFVAFKEKGVWHQKQRRGFKAKQSFK
jgi:hypothetical protein